MVKKRFRSKKFSLGAHSFLGVIFGLSSLILIGRLFGFIREILVAANFGVSNATDAAVVILTLPDFMVGLFLIGGFNAALTPALKKIDPKQRLTLVCKSFILFGGIFGIFAVLIAIFPKIILFFISPSLLNFVSLDFLSSFRLSLISLPIVAMIGIVGSHLATMGRFLIPPISVILYNIVLIVFLAYFFDLRTPLVGLSLSVIMASSLRLILHLLLVQGLFNKSIFYASRKLAFPPKFFSEFIFGVAGYSIVILAPVVFRSLYSIEGQGYLALFNFSHKLFEFAAGILIAPIILVLIPRFSSKELNDEQKLNEDLRKAIFAVLAIGIVGATVGVTFMSFFSQIIFLRGEMTNFGVDKITYLTSVMLVSFPFFALAQVCMARLNSRGLASKSLKWSAISLVLSVFLLIIVEKISGYSKEETIAVGYAIFHLILAIFLMIEARITNFVNITTIKKIITITLSCLIGILPFVLLISNFGDTLNVWIGAALSVPASLILIILNLRFIKPLMDVKIDRT